MAKELALKYGCNPNQKPARIYMQEGELPIEVLNGRPGYINFLDALNGWQLVKELKEATGMPAATSFKHVSPAGAAIGLPLDDTLKKIYFVEGLPLSPLACAYVRSGLTLNTSLHRLSTRMFSALPSSRDAMKSSWTVMTSLPTFPRRTKTFRPRPGVT